MHVHLHATCMQVHLEARREGWILSSLKLELQVVWASWPDSSLWDGSMYSHCWAVSSSDGIGLELGLESLSDSVFDRSMWQISD